MFINSCKIAFCAHWSSLLFLSLGVQAPAIVLLAVRSKEERFRLGGQSYHGQWLLGIANSLRPETGPYFSFYLQDPVQCITYGRKPVVLSKWVNGIGAVGMPDTSKSLPTWAISSPQCCHRHLSSKSIRLQQGWRDSVLTGPLLWIKSPPNGSIHCGFGPKYGALHSNATCWTGNGPIPGRLVSRWIQISLIYVKPTNWTQQNLLNLTWTTSTQLK